MSITSLPEDEQTSKHGGGDRYNAILEFEDHVWFEDRWMVASLCDE
jgi:hypothetical protein